MVTIITIITKAHETIRELKLGYHFVVHRERKGVLCASRCTESVQ